LKVERTLSGIGDNRVRARGPRYSIHVAGIDLAARLAIVTDFRGREPAKSKGCNAIQFPGVGEQGRRGLYRYAATPALEPAARSRRQTDNNDKG